MKLRRALLAAALFTCAAPALMAQIEFWPVWSHQGALVGIGRELAVTTDGGVIIASGGAASGEVRALDALGQLRWSTPLTIPAVAAARVEGVAVLTNGDVVALVHDGASPGASGGDYFVSRFSPSGVPIATTQYGGPSSDEAFAIAAHPSGGYVVAGNSWGGYGTPSTPGTFRAAFVARHDANGVELWVRRMESSWVSIGANAVVSTTQGEIRAYGWSFDWLDPYPRQAWFSLTSAGVVQTSALSGQQFGEHLWAYQTSDGSIFTGGRWYPGNSTGAHLSRRTPQGVMTNLYLSGSLSGESAFYAAATSALGGFYTWVKDDWNFSPALVGTVRYSTTGQVLWSQAAAGAVNAATPLPFNEIAISTAGAGAAVQRLSRGDVGTQGCAGQPNSTGAPAVLRLAGSASLSANALVPFASNLPPNVATLCAISRNAGFVAPFAGGQGTLCLAAPIGRSTLVTSSNEGLAAYRIDLTAMPTPLGPQAAQIGDTWRFQVWYRDTAGGGTTNLTSSVSVVVQ